MLAGGARRDNGGPSSAWTWQHLMAHPTPPTIAVIGLRHSIVDLWLGFASLLYRRDRPAAA